MNRYEARPGTSIQHNSTSQNSLQGADTLHRRQAWIPLPSYMVWPPNPNKKKDLKLTASSETPQLEASPAQGKVEADCLPSEHAFSRQEARMEQLHLALALACLLHVEQEEAAPKSPWSPSWNVCRLFASCWSPISIIFNLLLCNPASRICFTTCHFAMDLRLGCHPLTSNSAVGAAFVETFDSVHGEACSNFAVTSTNAPATEIQARLLATFSVSVQDSAKW